jgi:hypothetical protein
VFENVTRRARRMAAVVATGALAVTGLALPVVVNASPAAADNLTVATVTATVSTPNFSGQATDGLVDGQTIHVVADATGSERITSIQARICTQNANVQFDADFNPTQGGKCASAPLSANSDATVSANGTPGAAPIHAALDIRAGVGSNSYTTQSAQAVTITCNAANPCDLYVKVNNQSTTAQYKHFVMTFAGNPSAPANLGATPSPSQVALAWDVPTDLGNVPSSAISYTINYTDGVTPGSTTSSTNSKTLTLSNFSTYTFTVTANSIGSFASSPSGSAQCGSRRRCVSGVDCSGNRWRDRLPRDLHPFGWFGLHAPHRLDRRDLQPDRPHQRHAVLDHRRREVRRWVHLRVEHVHRHPHRRGAG